MEPRGTYIGRSAEEAGYTDVVSWFTPTPDGLPFLVHDHAKNEWGLDGSAGASRSILVRWRFHKTAARNVAWPLPRLMDPEWGDIRDRLFGAENEEEVVRIICELADGEWQITLANRDLCAICNSDLSGTPLHRDDCLYRRAKRIAGHPGIPV